MSERIRRGWVRATLLLCCLAFTTAGWDSCDGPCKTGVTLGVVVGAKPPSWLALREVPKEVWICPGTLVTFEWRASGDVKSAELTSLGTATVPTGYHARYVDKTTTFTITAHGDCDQKDSVIVHVYQPGVTQDVSLPLVNKKLPLWERKLSQEVWDPKLVIEKIRFVRFTEQGWQNVRPLNVLKTDIDGAGHDFLIDTQFARPWPESTDLRVTGNWKVIVPDGIDHPTSSVPENITLQMITDCKPQ